MHYTTNLYFSKKCSLQLVNAQCNPFFPPPLVNYCLKQRKGKEGETKRNAIQHQ